MSEKQSTDPEAIVECLQQQHNRGKGILKHQPVQRETCETWTAATREILADIYDVGSKRYREFLAANRQILTSFDTDPSYYLTQVVANLHRELNVLQKCIKEKRDEAEAAAALLALKGIKKAKPKIPAFLYSENDGGVQEVRSFLVSENFDVSAGSGKDVLWNLATQKNLRYAVILLSQQKRKPGSTSNDGLLVAGYLAGRLGRNRVLVLVGSNNKLTGAAGFLRAVPLKEKAAWQKEVQTDVSKLNA